MQVVSGEPPPPGGGGALCGVCLRQRQIRLFLEAASGGGEGGDSTVPVRSAAAVAAALRAGTAGFPAFAAAAGVRLSECLDSLWQLPPLKALAAFSVGEEGDGLGSRAKPRRQLQPRSSQRQRPICLDLSSAGAEAPLLRQCAANLGWKIADSFFAAADIQWFGAALSDEAHQGLASLVVNRLPFAATVSRKRWICSILSALSELEPERFDFYPRTLLLPEGLKELNASFARRRISKPPPSLQSALAAPPSAEKVFPKTTSNAGLSGSASASPEASRGKSLGSATLPGGAEGGGLAESPAQRVWILKPDGGAQGIGLRLACAAADVPSAVASGDASSAGDLFVAQEYVANPLCLNERKFDLRVYVLLLEVHPSLRVFVSRRGLARFCAEPYNNPRTCACGAGGVSLPSCRCETRALGRSAFSHFTNFAVNKSHRDFKRPNGVHDAQASKRLLEDVIEELGALGVDGEAVWRQVVEIVSKTVRAMAPLLSLKYRMLFSRTTTKRSRCFQLLGFDFLLDARHKVWLLEVNANPSLRADVGADGEESVVDRRVKEPLVGEALLLAYLALIKPAQAEARRAFAASSRGLCCCACRGTSAAADSPSPPPLSFSATRNNNPTNNNPNPKTKTGERCVRRRPPAPATRTRGAAPLPVGLPISSVLQETSSAAHAAPAPQQAPPPSAAAAAATSEGNAEGMRRLPTSAVRRARGASMTTTTTPPPWPASDEDSRGAGFSAKPKRLSGIDDGSGLAAAVPCAPDAPFVCASPLPNERRLDPPEGAAAYKARLQRRRQNHERQLQLLEREQIKLRLRRKVEAAEEEQQQPHRSTRETPEPSSPSPRTAAGGGGGGVVVAAAAQAEDTSSSGSSAEGARRSPAEASGNCEFAESTTASVRTPPEEASECRAKSALSAAETQENNNPTSEGAAQTRDALSASEGPVSASASSVEFEGENKEGKTALLSDPSEEAAASDSSQKNPLHGEDRQNQNEDQQQQQEASSSDGSEEEEELQQQQASNSVVREGTASAGFEKRSSCFALSKTAALRGKGGKLGAAPPGCCTYSAAARSTEAGESLIASSGLSSTTPVEGFASSCWQSDRANSSAFPLNTKRSGGGAETAGDGRERERGGERLAAGEELVRLHCCLWQPVPVSPSDVQTAPSAALLLLAECTDTFVELTRFPQEERFLSWSRWVAFVRHAGLDALVARLSVPVVESEGRKEEGASSSRCCRRFAQRPLCLRDLALLHSKAIRPSESQGSKWAAQAAAAAASAPAETPTPPSNVGSHSATAVASGGGGLGVWGFWKLVRSLAAALNKALPPCACFLQNAETAGGCGRLCAGDSWTLTERSRHPNSPLGFFASEQVATRGGGARNQQQSSTTGFGRGRSRHGGVSPSKTAATPTATAAGRSSGAGFRSEGKSEGRRAEFGFSMKSSAFQQQSAAAATGFEGGGGGRQPSSCRRLTGVPPLLLHRSISDVSGGADTEEETTPRSERLSPRLQLAKRAAEAQQFSENVAAAAAAAASGAVPGALFPPFYFVKLADPGLWKKQHSSQPNPSPQQPQAERSLRGERDDDEERDEDGEEKEKLADADQGQGGESGIEEEGEAQQQQQQQQTMSKDSAREEKEEKTATSEAKADTARSSCASSNSAFFLRWWPNADAFYKAKTPAERLECMRKTLSFLRFKARAFAKEFATSQTATPS